MRLEAISVSNIRQAVATFLGHAWGDLADSHWPKVDFDTEDRDQVLAGFVDERKKGCMRKYSVRLGNRRYPFMKLVFQESLVRDSFFFAVDTHDQLDIKETTPDYAEWLAIRDYNLSIKRGVEESWKLHGIPTFQDVLDAVEQETVPDDQRCPLPREPMVYVVDDDRGIAEGVRRILSRRGYAVQIAYSGEEALERLRGKRPDLILSDLEMGAGMTGLDFCEAIRETESLARVPFILATAAGIDLSRFDLIDGFLVKPYEIEILMTFLAKHIRAVETA